MSEALFKSIEDKMKPSKGQTVDKLARMIGVAGIIHNRKPKSKTEIAQILVNNSVVKTIQEGLDETNTLLEKGIAGEYFFEEIATKYAIGYRLKHNYSDQ